VDWGTPIYSGTDPTVTFPLVEARYFKVYMDPNPVPPTFEKGGIFELEVFGSAFESVGGTWPSDPDSDNDGYYDGGEKTSGTDPRDPASTPTDTDTDFMGDTFENDYFGDLTHLPNVDDDGDGWDNIEEYWYHTDPDDIDEFPIL
jgi:hypothetical protein